MQWLCEVMSTFPAGATECRRCFRDFRKEDRQWDVGSTSDGNSIACQSGKFDSDPDDSSAWLHDLLGQTVDKAIRMFKKQSRVDPSVAIALTLLLLDGALRWLCTDAVRKFASSLGQLSATVVTMYFKVPLSGTITPPS